jgi:glycosyltransferase involved in cell wall biosynthesis
MRLADRLFATRSVARDARTFAPIHAAKVRIVEPLTLVESRTYERDPARVVGNYGLPKKFFYVPGQFWLHKNHLRLFGALHVLRSRGAQPHVVLTGSPHDYRDPGHFQRLMRYAADHGVSDQIHYLGTVARPDVFDLVRQSICVVNPSLFEGWGYAVDEAASIGKRILASSIAAHRDQQAPACEYFDPRSTEQLADRLVALWRNAEPGPDAGLEARARARAPARVAAFGATLYSALEEAASTRRRGKLARARESETVA